MSCLNIHKSPLLHLQGWHYQQSQYENTTLFMEPEVKIFLRTILQTVSVVLLWMMPVTYFGIKEGLLFFDNGFTIWAAIFYVLMIASFIWLIRYLFRLWRSVPDFDQQED